jgi:SAM-dependent methyltransferase
MLFALINAYWGYCPVCNRKTIFLMSESFDRIRNGAVCFWCRSCSRHRHCAQVILDSFKDKGIYKLRDFRDRSDIMILNASIDMPIAKALGSGYSNIIHSEYFDGVLSGEYKNGLRCEDFQALSFRDNSLDLIISEDVFEHVENYQKGFQEVYRVLKPGGFHIFSIPFLFDRPTELLYTFNNGELELKEPVEYHGDPFRGRIPAFVRFGYNLLDELHRIGFTVDIKISSFIEYRRIGTFNSFTFLTCKALY